MKKLLLLTMVAMLSIAFVPAKIFAKPLNLVFTDQDGNTSVFDLNLKGKWTDTGGKSVTGTVAISPVNVGWTGYTVTGNGTKVGKNATLVICIFDVDDNSFVAMLTIPFNIKTGVVGNCLCCGPCNPGDCSCNTCNTCCKTGGGSVNYKVSGDEYGESNLEIYPNPSTGNISVEYSSMTSGTVQFFVRDISGRLLFNKTEQVEEGDDDTFVFALPDLNPGVYILQAKNGEEISTKKFTIVK